MDILFLGGVFTKEQQEEILKKSRGAIQFAANTLQWNLINGLDYCNGSSIKIISALFVGAYPKHYSDYYVRGLEWSHAKNAKDKNISFLNIFGIKHIWKGIILAKETVKWGKVASSSNKAIVVYSMHTPFIFAAAVAKMFNSNIHVSLVVSDLPEFMDLQQNRTLFLTIMKKLDRRLMNHFLKAIDSFVLLTKQMAVPIGVGNRPFIVMEGMVNPEENNINIINKNKKNEEKTILYTGTLVKKYGIMELLEAFSMISDTSYRLQICGEGEAREDIVKMALQDDRIKYFGQVSREDVLVLQRKATVLINPRSSEGEFTKYSFPSKTMEYLLSGTPTILKKLPGIPEEYFNYLYIIDEDTVKGMANKILEVCNKTNEELNEFGERAMKFVIEKKNYKKQTELIYRLINTNNLY